MERIYVVSEIKLVYKTKTPAKQRPVIKTSYDAVDIFYSYWDKDTIEYFEEVKLMLLNRANKVLGIINLSTGGTSGCIFDIKMMMQYALKTNAHGVIVAHNHPSGNVQPSEADKRITNKLKNASLYLDINFLDHLIITPNKEYFSFADEGIV